MKTRRKRWNLAKVLEGERDADTSPSKEKWLRVVETERWTFKEGFLKKVLGVQKSQLSPMNVGGKGSYREERGAKKKV